MNLEHYIQILREDIGSKQPDCNDGPSVLEMLYASCNDSNRMDDEKISADFDALYHAMNGMPLKEMDRVIYSVCTLCRDHEKSGFVHGVQVGMRLLQEINVDRI